MKKNLLTGLAVTAFAALALGLTACSETGVTPEDPMGLTATTETTFDMNAVPTEFTDATVDQPMMVRPDPNQGRPVRTPFGDLLRRLNLTEEQNAQVQALLASHNDCVKAALESLRAAEKAILDDARAQAEAIKADAKAGTITREAARAALRELNKATREALKALPGREEARAAVKACDDAFLAGLREILDETQTAMLERWLAGRKGPGNPPPPPGGGRGPGRGGDDSTGTGSGRGRG
jgi:multidrug efflux pump subunit AcrA (membrane-fusion protein)